jgi:lipopolysaccharide transport system ATP-binding protein
MCTYIECEALRFEFYLLFIMIQPMEPALRVEGVSKQYRIYDQAADRLKEMVTRGRWKTHRQFWALSDITFEVGKGTTFGIVGPNGCGKSTLLQIIAGTLKPTKGTISHSGRIAALLELGAGFNLEFTGRENVFMSTSLMGFSRAATIAMLPEIERFAEIGEFIDQPVKMYSSGMYVRLAFAAAVSIMPEILIVDEALAVGDAIFQHRCMRRIREMQENGTTILLASHDPHAIRSLCSTALLLHAGRMEAIGKPTDVLNRYQKLIMARETAYDASGPAADLTLESVEFEPDQKLSYSYRHGDGRAEIIGVQLLDAAHQRIELVETGEEVTVKLRLRFREAVEAPVCGFLIRNRHGVHIYGTNTDLQKVNFDAARPNEIIEVSFVFNCWLAPDTYSLTLAVHSPDGVSFDWLDDTLFFKVFSVLSMEGVTNLNASAMVRSIGVRKTYTTGEVVNA